MKLSARVGAIKIDGDVVRLAVVKTGGKRPKLIERHEAVATYSNEEDRLEALTQAVREVAKKVKARPALYVLCASSAWSIVRLMRIPLRGRSRVAAAIQFEIEPHLAFPIEDLVVDFQIIREVDGETEVLVVGLMRDSLEEQLAVVSEAGVSLEGVGLDAIGLTALWQCRRKNPPGLSVLVHVGEKGSTVAAVGSKNKLAFIRYVAMNAEKVRETPRAASREINNILRGIVAVRKDLEEIASLSLSGVDLEEEARSLFEADLHVPIDFIELWANVKGFKGAGSEGESASDSTEWAACIGAAAAASDSAYTFDFLKGDLVASSTRRGLVAHGSFTAGLLMMALVVYAGYSYVNYRHNEDEIERIGNEIWNEFAETFPDSEAAAERPASDKGGFKSVQLMEQEAELEGRTTKSLSVEMFTKPTMLDMLMEVANLMPVGIVSIDEMKISAGKTSRITIIGEVKDTLKFNDMYADLEKSTKFTVDPDQKRRESSGGKETYVITATR